MRNLLKNWLKEDSGQAIVEYIVMLSVAVSMILLIGTAFRRSLAKLWEAMARAIAAPCPGCPPPPGMRIR